MVDYAKKTVAELQEILKSRSLPSSGKKAELVARLTEADQAAEDEEQQAPPAEATSAPPKQTTQPTKEPSSDAPTTSAAPKTQPAPDTVTSPTANADDATAQSTSYSLHLPSSEVDAEMAKRKARAERFGTGAPANGESGVTDGAQADVDKALERAKRFGTGLTTMGKLDEALPSEREKGGRKRGRATEETITDAALEDPGLRRGFKGRVGGGGGGGGGGGNRGGRRNNSRKGERPTGVQKPGGGAAMSEKDRLAADARKKRFAAAS